jgi:transcriptional regulator with AAA-type ATPase domain/transcriptional regulatory protein LevR
MSMEIEKAKAAVLYPLSGLPMLIGGKTGVGKTTFAKLMYEYAKKTGRLKNDARFVTFNCADYANNPELVMAQLFGYARGAFTGADDSHMGLVEQADNGVLFLDEVHRLSQTAQEMLFFLMDFGQYRRLGEADVTRTSHPIIIMATTENRDSALLAAFNRRIPITVTLPTLAERTPLERLKLIRQMFTIEARKLNLNMRVDSMAVKALMAYDCPGNIGQLENDIKVACARGYVTCLMGRKEYINISILELPLHVKDGIRKLRSIYSDINLISGDLEIGLDGDGDRERLELKNDFDIYDILERRHREFSNNAVDKDYLELAMMLDVEGYFSSLLQNGSTGVPNGNILDYISKEALDITKQAEQIINREMDMVLDESYKVALALHFNAAISRIASGKPIVCPALSHIRKDYPGVFQTAEKIVSMMEQKGGLAVPNDEVGFIANLLLKMDTIDEKAERCGILVICYALGSAKTMARVANSILGKNYVHWLDVPCQEPSDSLADIAAAEVEELRAYDGIVMLVDSETLMQSFAALKDRAEKPVYFIPNISTSMVIEAALLAVEHKASAQQVYLHLREMEQGYNELYQLEAKKLANPDKKVILTACISGCGAAVKLKRMIEENFDLPEEIEIETMDIPSVEALNSHIAHLSSVCEVICVIGMDVGLRVNFPFISAEEFVIGNGIQRLTDILSSYHINKRCAILDSRDESMLEDMFFSGKYLSNYLFYLDGQKIAPFLRQCVKRIEESRGMMCSGKRIMLIIHMCSMVERLLFENRDSRPAVSGPRDLAEAMEPLSSAYCITIPDEEYEMIERILELVLDK